MHIKAPHAESDLATLHSFIETYPLGLLTTAIESEKHDFIQTSHIPLILDKHDSSDSKTNLGILRGHVARANPQARALIDRSREDETGRLDKEVLVLFNAPVHHYVPARFFSETKPATQRTVPTWNYAAVQVYGRLREYHRTEPATSDFLQKQIGELSNTMEARYDGKWRVDDAPASYIENMKKALIGIEIEITKIEGRFKLSQESGNGDWKGIVNGFSDLGTPEGETMARMIEEKGQSCHLPSPQADAKAAKKGWFW